MRRKNIASARPESYLRRLIETPGGYIGTPTILACRLVNQAMDRTERTLFFRTRARRTLFGPVKLALPPTD